MRLRLTVAILAAFAVVAAAGGQEPAAPQRPAVTAGRSRV
jgi:hypothetical protein